MIKFLIMQHGAEEGISVSLKSDILTNFLGLPITNSFITSLVLSLLLIIFVMYVVKKSDLRPSKLQLIIEFLIEGGYNFVKDTLGNEKIAKKVFPLIASLFIIILFFNLTKFIPGMESIKFDGHHLFKPVHSDLNMTLALSIVSFIVIQALGILVLGFWKYSGKFIQIKLLWGFVPFINPLGILELVSELAKVVSLSFRLFMNIFVGGILILLLQETTHYMLPVIAMLFEVFVALLQAGVFALLTLFYIKLATDEPH